ncbi:PQQ-binding-like beta-propeller repeat protein [Conexibacter sp. CPCC 206217]|uniref:outer membrane protein assembly factor BamB family protein n=1 Tax=Conexibacter sp. CPCC 206217 TaxID=3064574 RepID=UPI0027225EDF|nr:PQQ-binding-like beta-propeller repeat protein [Conexibacter sp. CPCC 206217]MDO8210586.1 PQQ-binding-like beta-propeller repeat protein [Conexibacter sp. CPCC 206217]
MQGRSFAQFVRRNTKVAAMLLGVLTLLVVAGCGGGGDDTTASTSTVPQQGTPPPNRETAELSTSPTAPPFEPAALFAPPGDNWITNGGGTTNDRYSPLDEITTANVARLRGDWLTHLNGSGTANKYSAEGQPLEYNGTIYIPTGADDVFAVDAASGRIKWSYRANMPDSLASVICCGWDNRGVALGDGMIFSGQLDGSLVALDQMTGRVIWETRLAKPEEGYTITAAPLYVDGKVIIGPSGAEYGVRGRMDAYDARTGRLVWRFYTIPGPGERGHESWPQDNDEWQHGGATTWNTPSYDPNLGMIYFSTSNAGNDYDGSNRAGDNLYAASIVALDVKTGKLKWAYQQVHHDLWDFDSPSPTVLIDAPIDGIMVRGIAEPSKNGYVFFLDRATGRPVFPIRETPVYQDEFQRTAKTQPIPTMEPFSKVRVDDAQLRALNASVASQGRRGRPIVINPGSIYSGVGVRSGPITATAPSAAGGDNWPPSSYNPKNHMYYVCAQDGAQGFQVRSETFRSGATYTGSTIFAFTGFNSPGTLTAYDMTTGTIAWRNAFPDACYSGAVSTAGDLVFVGRNRGELEAYDGRTGDRLWSFQTGAGANSTAAVYQVDGRQKIAFLSGGNALNGSTHGDNLWQFSLDGTMAQVRAGGAARAIEHAGDNQDAAPDNGGGDADAGRSIFTSNCSVCHGLTGRGGNGGPDLTAIAEAKQMPAVIRQVTEGGGGMPAFGGQLTNDEIANVAAYVTRVINR